MSNNYSIKFIKETEQLFCKLFNSVQPNLYFYSNEKIINAITYKAFNKYMVKPIENRISDNKSF